MTAPDLTNLTADELRRIAIGDGTTADDPYAAVDELHRRAQANALVQAERDEFDEELHTCRAIVGATSEHLHVDLEELVDKLRRTEADSRSWQELATARAQANDRLRSAAQAVLSWLNGEALEQYPSLAAEATHDVEPLRCNLETALAAAPAAPPTPAATVTDAEQSAYRSLRTMVATIANDLTERTEAPIPSLRAVGDMLLNCLDATASKEAEKPAVTDAEIEAAFEAFSRDVYGHAAGAFMGVDSDADDERPGVAARRSKDALRALIARRVASAGAAPVDSEREAAIDQAIRHHWNCARSHARGDTSPQCVEDCLKADERLRALMRSAPPQGRGDDGMRLVGLDLFSLRDSLAADRPAPVDAAIQAWRLAMNMAIGYASNTQHPKDARDRLISDRLDEAVRLMRSAPPAPGDQDAKLRELRARLLSTAASLPNRQMGHSDEDFDRGYVEACENWAQEIDRLLAAPAASAIAAAPEAPAWLEKLRVATNRMVDAAGYAASSLLSDVDIDLKDVRDFAFALREQVESHARRIEALERAAQDGGQ